jgi:TonB family protein
VNRPAQAVCLPSDRAALSGSLTSVIAPPVIPVEPVEPSPSGRTRASTSAAEFIKSTAVQSPAPEPEVTPTALPVDDLRAIWQRGQISKQPRPYQPGRSLEPVLRVAHQVLDRIHLWAQEWPASKKALIIGTAALAVVCLTIGGMMLRRQARAATIVQQVVTSQENFPAGRTTASRQPQLESSAMTLNARSAESIVPGLGSEGSKSTRTPELATPRAKIEIGKLSRPVLRSPGLSTSSELPPVMATQTKELILGDGLLDSSAPTPPGASTGGHLQPPKLVSSPAPAYPSLARMEKLQGVVVIDALVDATGRVTDMKVISGPAGLLPAAMAALHTWKYEPALLNGEPIPMHMKVSVNFGLH